MVLDLVWDSEFDDFYKIYPRHVARRAAEKAYRAARKRGATQFQLIAGAEKYADHVRGKKPEHIKHPATWLNGDCHLDELEAPRAPHPNEPGKPFYGIVPLDKI